jgi:Bacterial PH domain
MSEYDHEPVRGLPGELPEDEHILWQSAPNWVSHVKAALHIRLSALYFGIIVVWAVTRGDSNTAIGVSILGLITIGLFTLFAWGVGRTTVYTLTNKRIIFRIGVALNKCINIPLSEIESANLKMLDNGHGNVVLQLKGMPRLGYIMLWPHARSLRFVRPQPMLRAIPDAQAVSAILFKATQKVQSVGPLAERTPDRAHQPAFLGVMA